MCRCHCRCRCLKYETVFWCFDVSFIANAIDAVGRGRGRRRRRLRLRHRRRREHALFCSRLYNICRVHKLLNWSIQEGIIYVYYAASPWRAVAATSLVSVWFTTLLLV